MSITKTILYWQYKPVNFFEVPFQYSDNQYILNMQNGNAESILSTPHEMVPEKVQKDIENKVLSFFNARMLLKHKPYELGSLNIRQHHSDGNIATLATISGKASIVKLENGKIDFLLTDSSAQVILDTKAERVAKEESLIKVIASSTGKHPLINKLITSYKTAVSDPSDELVHLYEIIDALKKHFTSKANAIDN